LEIEKLVDSILVKSRSIVSQRDALKEENLRLKAQVVELENQLTSKDMKISELIDKQKIQLVAGALGRNEKSSSTRKIDEVVREIDRCIALLNE
jgi:dynactin complex subunit